MSSLVSLSRLPALLKGKNAIVTGSTSGIGLGIARALASNGCNIMLNGFGEKSAILKLQDEFRGQFSGKVGYSDADLRVPSSTRGLVAQTADLFGGVDILVNNAGIQFVSPVEAFPEDKWDDIMAINLSSVFHATKAALPYMKKAGWGRVVNISSVHGLVASANKSAYVAAKHGVVGFTKTLALEMAGSGITANCVNPGWVLTPLVQKQIDAKAAENNWTNEQATVALLGEKQPSKQFTTPEQLGEVVSFLCSDAASQITGISVPVDGGWTSQ